MFTVIKLGGCNGSGKTSVARAAIALLTNSQPCTVRLPSGKVTKVYLGKFNGISTVILGSYEKVCGGMDTIGDKDDRLWLVEIYAKNGNIVLYEGLLTGKTYGAMGQLSEKHVRAKGRAHGAWLYAFMDTPFDECVRRTEQRRAAAAEAKGTTAAPLDPERTLRPTFNSCQHLLEKLRGTRAAKVGPQPYPHPTILLGHKKKPAALAKALLQEAERMYELG